MSKPDIQNREDVFVLVSSFYDKIKKHEFLGPFFKQAINDWDAHIENLTNFWESSLFLQTRYYGDPLKVHVKVDEVNNNTITQEHFGHWLNLWFQTIDEHFEGQYAVNAKRRAQKMGTFLFLKIFEARQV